MQWGISPIPKWKTLYENFGVLTKTSHSLVAQHFSHGAWHHVSESPPISGPNHRKVLGGFRRKCDQIWSNHGVSSSKTWEYDKCKNGNNNNIFNLSELHISWNANKISSLEDPKYQALGRNLYNSNKILRHSHILMIDLKGLYVQLIINTRFKLSLGIFQNYSSLTQQKWHHRSV